MSRINFPRVHIATSVVNRILNTRDELEGHSKSSTPPAPTPPPAVPDPELAGAEIDARVSSPTPADVPPLEAPEATPDELAGVLARGDNLISA